MIKEHVDEKCPYCKHCRYKMPDNDGGAWCFENCKTKDTLPLESFIGKWIPIGE